MTKLSTRLLVAALLGMVSLPALAQEMASNDRIAAIEVQGSQRIEPATVKSYLTIHEGEAFDGDRDFTRHVLVGL